MPARHQGHNHLEVMYDACSPPGTHPPGGGDVPAVGVVAAHDMDDADDKGEVSSPDWRNEGLDPGTDWGDPRDTLSRDVRMAESLGVVGLQLGRPGSQLPCGSCRQAVGVGGVARMLQSVQARRHGDTHTESCGW